ncbi:uncharacterized protein M6B38_166510 [Iris pallida]|uniref:Uncharacterized protein n=1 Tax=Iris pallida TaxID=29817 RepID=A0AAX6EW99_IRIPA|nr:uncharacterized protein M6B38_166510 [Iris pallida]
MDSYQPFSPSFKSSLMATGVKPAPPAAAAPDGFVGFLDVFIHEARDIHNICIYHKQDVYAKLYLTTDRESAASTQIINGGGRNPSSTRPSASASDARGRLLPQVRGLDAQQGQELPRGPAPRPRPRPAVGRPHGRRRQAGGGVLPLPTDLFHSPPASSSCPSRTPVPPRTSWPSPRLPRNRHRRARRSRV